MRFPVFARGVNPSVEKPILHKKKSYVFSQVESGRADWVDPLDHSKGIIARETLYFGPREFKEEVPTDYSPIELPGLRFIDPNPKRNFTVIREGWEWNCA